MLFLSMATGYLILAGIVALVAANLIWNSWRSGRAFCSPLPQPFRSRESQEDAWRRRYYNAESMAKADAVLRMVCEAFLFNRDSRYRFVPDDRLRHIYQSCYPRWKFWRFGDSMELESLSFAFRKEFGIEIAQHFPDITLGGVVNLVLDARPTKEEMPPTV